MRIIAKPRAAPDVELHDSSHRVRAVAADWFLAWPDRAAGMTRANLLAHAAIGRDDRDRQFVLRLGGEARPALERAASGDDPVVQRKAGSALRVLDFRTSTSKHKDDSSVPPAVLPRIRQRLFAPKAKGPTVLILTPVKDAAAFIPGYYKRIAQLTYRGELLSLAFLESDSRDATHFELQDRLPRFRKRFRHANVWKKDFDYRIPDGAARWAEDVQAERRSVLARSRNHLLSRGLDDEDWVLWLDVDVIEYPADIVEKLLAVQRDIVQPHRVLDCGGSSFDKNAWRDHGRLHLDDLPAEGDVVELYAVGGTMLPVRADLHRESLVFPATPYGAANPRARASGELETEGLGIWLEIWGTVVGDCPTWKSSMASGEQPRLLYASPVIPSVTGNGLAMRAGMVLEALASRYAVSLLVIKLYAGGGEIEVWGDGPQTRSFLYIDESLEGARRLMDSGFTGPVNIGSDEMVSINQRAEMAMSIAGEHLRSRHNNGPSGVRGRNSDNALSSRELAWRSTHPLREGLEKTYAWIAAQVKNRTPLRNGTGLA